MLTQILNYQSVEGKLIRLQNELNNNKAKSFLAKMVATVKEEQNKLLVLENQAKEITTNFEKSKEDFAKLEAALEKLVATDVETMNDQDLVALNKKITDLSNKLSNLGRSISQAAMIANQTLKEFDKVKNNIILAKEKHRQAKEEYDKLVASLEPQIAEQRAKLESLEKQVDSKIMAKYKHARNDGIFPVFVALENNSCGGCRMSISAAYVNKLKENGFVECEQCRRFIYQK
jgi:predicted  nucleic acid-binding Zn-ribbon protein